jgi:hypothetical protein
LASPQVNLIRSDPYLLPEDLTGLAITFELGDGMNQKLQFKTVKSGEIPIDS